ncbi:methyltransferase domain-containing protein [Archangium violaceum]|uniref:methyltransferase n=1 Tax=Archangium violaceum TaxID=83451 RepID=UPI00193C6F6E|nr:methyltransferase [Archangium violaceum]QRK08663.1 methyltransferase domain-containing protein [Archangium violaceum]
MMAPRSATPPALAKSLHFWARNASNESALLRTSLSVGLFDALPVEGEGTPVTVRQLAEQVGATVRGVRSLVELLVCLGLVHMDDARGLTLARPVAAFLRDAPFKERLHDVARWWGPVGLLEDAVRSGEAVEHGGQRWDVLDHYRRLFLETTPAPSPEAEDFFDRFARSSARTWLLVAVGRMGLLDQLATGPQEEATLRAAMGASERGLRTVLDVLAHLGLTRTEGTTVRFTDEARQVLEGKALQYLLRSFSVSAQYWEALERLDETVRHERFILDLKDPEVSRRFYADNSNQITAVFASHFQLSRRAASTIAQVRPLTGASVLDIGTGSGVWGVAFARTEPTAHVTYFDQEAVLAQAKRNVEQLQALSRARFWAGNLFTQDFGSAAYDFIILPQVLNVLRPESLPDMFRRVARALKPDGILVIAEYVLDERRDGPLDHLYFGLRRFLTNEGDLLSHSEYRELLADVGLTASVCLPLPTQELLLAARSGVTLPTRLAPTTRTGV